MDLRGERENAEDEAGMRVRVFPVHCTMGMDVDAPETMVPLIPAVGAAAVGAADVGAAAVAEVAEVAEVVVGAVEEVVVAPEVLRVRNVRKGSE